MTKPLAVLLYEALLPGSQLVHRLQELGYEVRVHTEPSSFVDQIREVKPLVIIMDLASKTADIPGLIRELRQSPEIQHIPVLAFARDTEEALRNSAASAGATMVTGDAAVLVYLPQLLDQVLEVEL